MSYLSTGIITVAVATAFTIALDAQKNTPMKTGSGGSPHLRSEWTVDGANISIEYGRPMLKGRSEADLMPHGRVWRTGADEQTTLTTDRPLKFGTLAVPAGTYGIHTIPGPNEWQLIISKRPSGWGIPYPEGQDLGRVPMTLAKPASPVEQLTISIDDRPAGAVLRIEWGGVAASVPFTVG
jgi:hypothetical protein